MKQPLVLMILDGWGKAPACPCNAITVANTPNLDAAFARYPSAELACSGMAVGLPQGQMGNSEVGHTNLGAGRVVYQELTRITKSIDDGNFFSNEVLLEAIHNAKTTGGTVHLMGLLSDGGVHSHIEHLFALLRLCSGHHVPVRVHCFLDGRDTPPASGAGYLRQLEEYLATLPGDIAIGTVCGRFYAMDRDSRWERLELAYRALVCDDPVTRSKLPSHAVENSYESGVTDEFVRPINCAPNCRIEHCDSVIFYNFRPDRARELTRALCDDAFDGFARPGGAVKP
ncbi:MAG: phosphoglycerate mutase (2,3-diphosphoglycerate-independent), partial [Clostridia bacterium]|nr:phosphoglycerate mutase (2,3-diphosphoglycerate-independent) [Clostridia bacterium]